MAAILIAILVLAAYLCPTLVAVCRCKANQGSILVLNLLLGWTFIAWVIALAMAVAPESAEA